MGVCKSKTADKPKQHPQVVPRRRGSQYDSSLWPVCHFCHKKIPSREYNAHTVQCDEREVTCWHSWCREIIRQGDLQAHMEECAKTQKTICAKCGAHVLVTQLQSHKDSCELKQCEHCSEQTIGRILKYCPRQLLGNLPITTGPFATEALRQKFSGSSQSSEFNFNVARIQHLFRWAKARVCVEDQVFRLIHKEMDLKKEGFAIFKAHDRFSEAHVVAPKRSRSILQVPTVPPSSTDHYFPAASNIPITIEVIQKMITDLTNHRLLPYAAAWRIFTDGMNHLNTLPNIVTLTPFAGARLVQGGRWHQGGKIVVVGDLHGQLADLLHILQECGMPSESTFYVFNGDFVDRGPYGVEVLLILFSLMLACPKYVALNRGNHECDYMNEEYGFDVEVSTKYDRNIFRLIQRCFCALPLGTIVGSNVFVVHGGLPRRRGITMMDLGRIQRFRQIPMPEHTQPEEDEIFQDLLWSDPRDTQGWAESERGAGVNFGPDVTTDFIRTNGLKLVVRSHEEFSKGYEEHHDKRLVTVFSASNYDGPETNNGAFMLLTGDCTEPSYHTYQVYEDDYMMHDLISVEDQIQTPTSVTAGRFGSSFHLNQTASVRLTPLPFLKKKRTRDEVLRVLRERIYQRRHRLMAYFTKLDRTHKGSVWKIEWVETMRNVLNLDLPWFFLRPYVAEDDPITHRVLYSHFLSKFHNGMMQLWLKDWETSMAAHIMKKQQTTHRMQHLHSAFSKDNVNYNEFCSVMRTIDYSLSDAQLFQLFQFFDRSGMGHINGKVFLEEIDSAHKEPHQLVKWDLDAMEQLQNIVIQGRSQLHSIFKVNSKDRCLTREKFMNGMLVISRGMKRQLTSSQKEAIYNFMNPHKKAEIHFECFLQAFVVYDVVTKTKKISSHESLADIFTPPTFGTPVMLRDRFPSNPDPSNQAAATTT